MSEYPLGRELATPAFIAEVTKIAAFPSTTPAASASTHLHALTGADLATMTNAIEQRIEPRPADTGGSG